MMSFYEFYKQYFKGGDSSCSIPDCHLKTIDNAIKNAKVPIIPNDRLRKRFCVLETAKALAEGKTVLIATYGRRSHNYILSQLDYYSVPFEIIQREDTGITLKRKDD